MFERFPSLWSVGAVFGTDRSDPSRRAYPSVEIPRETIEAISDRANRSLCQTSELTLITSQIILDRLDMKGKYHEH